MGISCFLVNCFRRQSNAPSTHFAMAIIILGTFFQLAGCKTVTNSSSRQKFTVADKDAKNFAMIIGSPNDLPGVGRDVANVSGVIKSLDQGYDVHVLAKATKDQILSKAAEISQYLTPESTVFFYYSGHGTPEGQLVTEGLENMDLSEVAGNLGRNMTDGKFKRFIAVIDACHSGQSVDGNEAMFLDAKQFSLPNFVAGMTNGSSQVNTGLFSPRMAGEQKQGTSFEQGLVVAAARASEESLDGGISMGGFFTYSWKQALYEGGSKSIRDILERTKDMTLKSTNNFHTPIWKAMPDSLLDETIDLPRKSPSSNTPANNNPVNGQNTPTPAQPSTGQWAP